MNVTLHTHQVSIGLAVGFIRSPALKVNLLLRKEDLIGMIILRYPGI